MSVLWIVVTLVGILIHLWQSARPRLVWDRVSMQALVGDLVGTDSRSGVKSLVDRCVRDF